MPEFDELKLQVTLVDNATAQLRTIKQSLDDLGGGSSAQNLERLKRQTSELDEQLRKMVETVSKGPKAFLDLARNVTVAGVSIGTFTLAAEKVLETVDDLTKKLVELQHIANQTGWDPAKIKQIEEAYARHSISSQQAQQEIKAFAESLEDFSRRYSETRINLYRDFPRENEIINKLVYQAMNAAPDVIEKFNAMKKGAQDVFEYFEKRGDPDLGKRIQRDILRRFGAPEAINVDEMVKPIDDAMSANLKHQIEQAEKYEQTTKKISQNWEAISKSMKVGLMDSGLIEALKWVDSLLDKWRAYQRAQPAGPPTPPPGLPPLGGLPAPGAPGSRAAPTLPMAPGGGGGAFFMGGGGVTSGGSGGRSGGMGSIPDIGELLKPSANAIQVPPRPAGPTGAHGWPLSTNVEDRRTPELMQSQNDQTKTLINEMKRLNAILSGEEKPVGQQYGMLAMPGGAGAGLGAGLGGPGGYGQGGTGRGAPGGPGSGTPGTPGETSPAQPPPAGPTGAPLGGVHGGQPFGVNVSPERFSQITGLPPSFMNVSVGQRSYAHAISTGQGAGGVGLDAKFTGGKPTSAWPTATEGGGGGGGGGSGNLAQDRERFKKELDANPQLKALAVGAMRREGGLHSNLEQLFNYASMRGMTIDQALHSGQYGPVTGRNRIPEAELRRGGAGGDKELERVYGGSNITDYATDQGMRGDPNFAKYMANREYWNMHQVEGAWFSSHGERGRRWAQTMRERAAAQGGGSAPTAAAGPQVTETLPSGAQVVSGAMTSAPITGVPAVAGMPSTPGQAGGKLSAVLEEGANVVRGGGNPQKLKEFINSQGYKVDDNWCGDFAAAVVTKAGGTPPKNPAWAMNWHDYGEHAEIPQAGDIITKWRLSHGHGHVGVIKSFDPKTNTVEIEQGNTNAVYKQSLDSIKKVYEIRHGQFPPETQVAQTASGLPKDPFAWPGGTSESTAGSIKRMNAIASGEDRGITLPTKDDDILKGSRYDAGSTIADGEALESARRNMDKLNAPKRVEGKGDINVTVKAESNGESKSPLKKVDMPVHSSGDKAADGHPAPAGATGGGKAASNEINY
jgi:hypothetical protein